jgi:hypothetical protein
MNDRPGLEKKPPGIEKLRQQSHAMIFPAVSVQDSRA